MDGIGERFPKIPPIQNKRGKFSQIALIWAFKGGENKCSGESKGLGFRQKAGKLLAFSLFATGAPGGAGLTPHSQRIGNSTTLIRFKQTAAEQTQRLLSQFFSSDTTSRRHSPSSRRIGASTNASTSAKPTTTRSKASKAPARPPHQPLQAPSPATVEYRNNNLLLNRCRMSN